MFANLRFFLISCAFLVVTPLAEGGFVTRLLDRESLKSTSARENNLQEYYGRFPMDKVEMSVDDEMAEGQDADQEQESKAFLTMLLSYEYATETIRFHFNMKEPGHKTDAVYAETDIQFNTHLDLRSETDQAMVNKDKEIINVSHMVTVYGFSQDRLTMRKTCLIDIELQEVDGQVNIAMMADPLAGGSCLHRDSLTSATLEAETDRAILERDDLFFTNLEALESMLTVATFKDTGVEGTWFVTQDDFYSSQAQFKSYFALKSFDDPEKPQSSVIFKVKDYDMVGPEEFHQDRDQDTNRDVYGKPWFEVIIKFESTSKEPVVFTLVYPLDDKRLLINKNKRSFRSSVPKIAHVQGSDGTNHSDCGNIALSFQVVNSYIKYILSDPEDQCIPYMVEGKWHLDFTKDEELEQLVENTIAEDQEQMTATEKEEKIKDNDILVESMATKIDNLTDDQLEILKDVAKQVDSNIEELKDQQKKRWDTNYVEHDYDKKIEEQKDWQERGKWKVQDLIDQAVEEREAKVQGAETSWELKGAAWAILFISLFGGCFYYFCYRRSKMRQQPQYTHVMPAGPGFA